MSAPLDLPPSADDLLPHVDSDPLGDNPPHAEPAPTSERLSATERLNAELGEGTSITEEILTTGSRRLERTGAIAGVMLLIAGLVTYALLRSGSDPIDDVPEAALDRIPVIEGELAQRYTSDGELRDVAVPPVLVIPNEAEEFTAGETWALLEEFAPEWVFAYQSGNGAVIVNVPDRTITVLDTPGVQNSAPVRDDVLISSPDRTIGVNPSNLLEFHIHSNEGRVTTTASPTWFIVEFTGGEDERNEVWVAADESLVRGVVVIPDDAVRIPVPGKGVLFSVEGEETYLVGESTIFEETSTPGVVKAPVGRYGEVVTEAKVVAASEAGFVWADCEGLVCVPAFTSWDGVRGPELDVRNSPISLADRSTLSPDGMWLTSLRGRTVWFTNMRTGQVFGKLLKSDPHLTWTPDSSFVAWLEFGPTGPSLVSVIPESNTLPRTVPLSPIGAPAQRNSALQFFLAEG